MQVVGVIAEVIALVTEGGPASHGEVSEGG
jgi:hypothetical protein